MAGGRDNKSHGHKIYHRAIRLQWRGIVAIVVGIWAAFALWACHARQAAFDQHAQVLERLNSQVAEETLHRLRLTESFLRATDHWLQLHRDRDPRSDPAFARLIDEFRELSDKRVDIRVVSQAGLLSYVSSGVRELGAKAPVPQADVSAGEYFQEAMKRPARRLVFGKPVQDPATARRVIPVAMKLSRPVQGIAVVFAALELHDLEAFFESTRLQPHGSVLLARDDLTIMLRVPDAATHIGKSLPRDSVVARHYPARKQGVHFIDTSVLDRLPRLVSYRALDPYPLIVVATSSLDDMLNPWFKNLAWVAVSLSLITAILLVGTQRVTKLMRSLDQLATVDALTQLANRSFFYTLAETEFRRSKRYHRKLALLLIDIDHFKQVNDRYGHAAGDAVLQEVARLCKGSFRDVDVLGRVGGEEFAVLLPESDLHGATIAAERACDMVASHRHRIRGHDIAVTLSIGVAELKSDDKDIDHLAARADHALYRAKAGGRGRVAVSEGGAHVPRKVV